MCNDIAPPVVDEKASFHINHLAVHTLNINRRISEQLFGGEVDVIWIMSYILPTTIDLLGGPLGLIVGAGYLNVPSPLLFVRKVA